jgi:hypothetical protein
LPGIEDVVSDEDCRVTLRHLRDQVGFPEVEILRRDEVAMIDATFGVLHSPVEPVQVERHERRAASDPLLRQ